MTIKLEEMNIIGICGIFYISLLVPNPAVGYDIDELARHSLNSLEGNGFALNSLQVPFKYSVNLENGYRGENSYVKSGLLRTSNPETVSEKASTVKTVSKNENTFQGLPKGLSFTMKWALEFPFVSFTRLRTPLQFAATVSLDYPDEWVHGDTPAKKSKNRKKKPRKRREVDDWSESESWQREWLYARLENYLTSWGLEGRACLQRAVCEVAEAAFEEDSFLGAALNLLLRPSLSNHTNAGYQLLLQAERRGQCGGDCCEGYAACPVSIFDSLPFLSHTIREVD